MTQAQQQRLLAAARGVYKERGNLEKVKGSDGCYGSNLRHHLWDELKNAIEEAANSPTALEDRARRKELRRARSKGLAPYLTIVLDSALTEYFEWSRAGLKEAK